MDEPLRITTPGIYTPEQIPMSAYVADPCPEPSLTKGTVKEIIYRTPAHAHYKHARLGGHDSNSARSDLGSGAHSDLLGGAEIDYIDADNWKKKADQEKQRRARSDGKIPLLEKQRDGISKMSEAARLKLLEIGIDSFDSERTIIWQEDGVWLKTRPDIIATARYLIDYKTAKNADPIAWTKSTVVSGGYDIQAAMAVRGLERLTGDHREYLFLVQETEPPFCASLVGVDTGMLDLANQKIDRALPIWRECLANNHFPGYGHGIHWATVPVWEINDFEARI
jgi:hypothetical protein